jgi:hypothetical protein
VVPLPEPLDAPWKDASQYNPDFFNNLWKDASHCHVDFFDSLLLRRTDVTSRRG